VAEAAREPGALAVLERLGINHCCGAHLMLAEAAAAAGVPFETLVRALEAVTMAGRPPAPAVLHSPDRVEIDVRGLEPPHPMLRVLQRLDTLGIGQTLDVLHDRRPMLLYPQLEARGFAHETDEPEPGLVRIRIRRPTT
jgi:uncharacterized protein (DUF2249 family)